MPITYTVLTSAKSITGSIKHWLNYDKLDSVGVLEDAQMYLYQQLRTREMRASVEIPIGLNASTAPLPAGFLEPRGNLRDITNYQIIRLKDEDDLEAMRHYTGGVLDTGDFTAYAIFDELLNFDRRARSARTLRMLYWKSLPLLSGSNESNFLCTRYPHLLRKACLAFGYAFMQDDAGYAREMQFVAAMLGDVNAMDELSRTGEEVLDSNYTG